MFDIGWTELLLIGVTALIVVGPKDLPGMFRALGRFTARMRSMAREFQRAMDQAADESGIKDVTADLKTATSTRRLGLDAVQDAAKKFKGGWKADLNQIGSNAADDDGPQKNAKLPDPETEVAKRTSSSKGMGDTSSATDAGSAEAAASELVGGQTEGHEDASSPAGQSSSSEAKA